MGIDVSFSSSGYLDVSVHRVPLHTLWIYVWILEVCSRRFPHSDISGSSDICSSPKLFAAYHVFHRLLVPRHPPCALISLTIRLQPRVRPPSSVHSVAPLASWFFFSWFHIFRYGLGCLFSALLILIRNVSFLPICGFQGTWRSFCCRLLRTLSGTSGDGEIRTLDPLLARQVLSQLSYTPTDAGRPLVEAIPFLSSLFLSHWLFPMLMGLSGPYLLIEGLPYGLKWALPPHRRVALWA